MSSVSLCMIVKNEEKILRKSLESIKDCVDEIVICDTGSTDKTVEIAEEFTSNVQHFGWIDDFSAARNYCAKFATCEYIFRWDADYYLKQEFKDKLLQIKETGFKDADIVQFRWNVDFGDDGIATKTIRHYFLYKRDKFHWESPIHNQLVPNVENSKMKRIYFPFIEIDHLKDPSEKGKRYSQTSRILEQELEKNPSNARLLFFYAEGLLFDKNFESALEFLLKYLQLPESKNTVVAIDLAVFCCLKLRKAKKAKELFGKYSRYEKNPRYMLAYADTLAALDNIEAIKWYERYLKDPIKNDENVFAYDYERFFIHPRLMLGFLYSLDNSTDISRIYLREVIEKTHNLKTKLLAKAQIEKI